MLFPQNNKLRQKKELAKYWEFLIDENESYQAEDLFASFKGQPIAVPASWNEQFAELRDFLGIAWYKTSFNLPWGFDGKTIFIRFGSVNYLAKVWLNGHYLGKHEGGHLPFEFEVGNYLKEENILLVQVDAKLAFDRVPPGNLKEQVLQDQHQVGIYPAATFDFFPYAGIHRPVVLYAVNKKHIKDFKVETQIDNKAGIVKVDLTQTGELEARLELNHNNKLYQASFTNNQAQLKIPNAKLWSPQEPNLHSLSISLLANGKEIDKYVLDIGIRTIEVKADKLLLNGQEILLKGFGKHEDFPVIGRGEMPAATIKDYSLMNWLGANSFRTSHYPYSEETLALADKLGYLVIAETASVGLYFKEDGLAKRLELTKQFARELIERDKNHPSVIIWSLANEARTTRPGVVEYFKEVYDEAKNFDTTRPITIVSDMFFAEDSFDFFDMVCLNIYRGWYQESGRLADGFEKFGEILDKTFERFKKPIIVTEFGADAIAGHHSLPAEMFSEEYQLEFLEGYIKEMNKRDYVVGQHIWNMCDFKTAQGIKRPMAINFKGVFTRDRRPKMAAHMLKRIWNAENKE